MFSATVRAISEIFSWSCATWRALLKFRGTWGSGLNFGPGPQGEIFYFFWRGWVWNLLYGNHSNGGPLWRLKLKKNSSIFFRENWVQIFWGWGTLSSSPPWGAFVPHLTLGDFGPRDPNKHGFCSGAIAPHLGRYGVWPVCTLAHFCAKSARQFLEFLSRSIVPTAYYRFWEFKQNRWSRIRANFAQSWEKREKSLFGVLEAKIAKSRGRYNGLMLNPPPGGAVTVRDRPHNIYEVE